MLVEQVREVYEAEYIRTGSQLRAWKNLSEEGREILIEAGFTKYKQPIKPKEESYKERWKQYRKEVKRLTEGIKDQIPNIHLRSFKHYHIDHITSIWYGFKNNIPAEQIARLDNLRMLPAKENMLKGRKCAHQ